MIFSSRKQRRERFREALANAASASNTPENTLQPLPESDRIYDLVDRLPGGSPIQRIALSLLTQTYRPLDGVQSLFTALATTDPKRWRERSVAAWALGRVQLTPKEHDAAVGMLLDALEDHQRDSIEHRVKRTLGKTYAALSIPFLISLFFKPVEETWPGYIFGTDAPTLFVFFVMLTVIFVLPITAFQLIKFKKRANILRALSAESLGRLQSPESVATLAGALFDSNTEVQQAVALALHETLPTLTEAHFGLFGAQSMANLGEALRHGDNLLVHNVLEALAKVGTSHALPYVERVAREGRTTRLRDRAIEVVEILKERQARENEAKTLMRASLPYTSAPDSLLRSSFGSGETAPQQMLRATGQPEQDAR